MKSLRSFLSCSPGKLPTDISIIAISYHILKHAYISHVSTEYHNLTFPPCMDLLISSGVEKVIQSTIKEIHAFEGPEAHLMHQVLESQKFTHCLNALAATIKNIVKQNPKFLDDFECNVRKRLLIWIIKEVQKSVDNNLRQQFDL
jgi:hypothetical protein